MKSVIVTLADKQYTIHSLKFKAEREWRKKYDAPIMNLLSSLASLKGVSNKKFDNTSDFLKEVGSVFLAQAGELISALLQSPDTIMDALCEYSPVIAADRDFIEENCYQDDIAKAFSEVVQIAFPFGQLLQTMTNLGSLEKAITPNSPSPNGDSSKTI